jgi:hypothetical protein
MKESFISLKNWIADMANLIEHSENPDPKHYTYFLDDPSLAINLVDLIDGLDEVKVENEERAYYSACVYALDICVAQLQSAKEANNKSAGRLIEHLMDYLAQAITTQKHTLSFWLPILNAFYEVHVDLSQTLQEAYFSLASEEELDDEEEVAHINSIRELILDLSELGEYEIVENLFVQSYAMPPDFFSDLVCDLYSIEEGKELAILFLLHPKAEVREVVFSTFEVIMEDLHLSPRALTRLQAIQKWFPSAQQNAIKHWIKLQRKKGVTFDTENKKPAIHLRASEVDGTGAQGIFMHYRTGTKYRLCGLLLKQGYGIKDAWVTPPLAKKEVERFYNETFDESVVLRKVEQQFIERMVNHFLALTIADFRIPDLHFLEMQEELGLEFQPIRIEPHHMIEQMAIQISPFTQEVIDLTLKRTKHWPHTKQFTESWYLESSSIDKLVNRHCSFVKGVKVCQFEEAIEDVFSQEFESNRDFWMFHFLWIAFWLQSNSRKNDKTWQDSFILGYCIHSRVSLKDIPIMYEICYQTVMHSMETMQERKTHLNPE